MVLRGGRNALTKGCLISTPSKINSKEFALAVIFFPMKAGDDKGIPIDID